MPFTPDVRDPALAGLIREASSRMDPEATGESPRLGPLGSIRAVVFDVYGTLFISGSGDISLAKEEKRDGPMREALTAAGIESLPEDALDAVFLGEVHRAQDHRRKDGIEFPEVEIREVWQAFLQQIGHPLPDGAIERLATDYETRVNPVWPMPGLGPVLTELRERGQVLGIVSNAQFFTPALFHAFLADWPEGLGFAPERCVWSYRMREGKPSTRLYGKLAASLREAAGIEPGEVLYVGNDLRNDVWPAQATGFRTALFAGDARSLRWRSDDPRCAGVEPDAVLTDLAQVTELLGG